MRFIREEVAALSLASNSTVEDYRCKHLERYKSLALRCCGLGGCFDEVVPRFHNVRGIGTVEPKLFVQAGNELHLQGEVGDFLSSRHRIVEVSHD